MENQRWFIGTDLKFQITLTAEGFNQGSDRYDLDFYCGDQLRHFTQKDIVTDGDGHYYLLVPTAGLTPGMMRLVITAYVPDTDFGNRVRKEVESVVIGPLRPAV